MIDLIYQLPLDQLEKKGNKFNFRCPCCNDSAKSIKKKRAWIYQKNSSWQFHCFNCSEHFYLNNFIKQYFPDEYFNFIKQSFKKTKDQNKEEQEKQIQEEIKLFYEFPLISLDKLDKNHEAYQYIQNRKIPLEAFNKLYYSNDFTKFINKMTNDRYKDWNFTSKRIVIPYYTRDKKIFMFQGRDLDKNSNMRYLSIKLDEDKEKIYGLERIDYSKQIFITEGPFDSLFVNNCVAMGGSDLSEEILNKYFNKNQSVLIFDLERRNKEINEKIEKWLKLGYKIVLWPKYLKKYGKDINNFIENDLTIEEVNNIIHRNIIYGKQGLLKFNLWRVR